MAVGLVLDAGALIGIERRDDRVRYHLEAARRKEITSPIVPTAVLAEVWRDIPRQASLNQFLRGCTPVPLDEESARRAGLLLAATGGNNVIDAVVVEVASRTHSVILTADPDDLALLAEAAGLPADYVVRL